MSAPLVDFESENSLKAKRDERRKTRETILEKAKKEHDKRERKKEAARQRGEDTWMLPSVNLRIDAQEEKSRPKKHKKEKKKKKKHKKEKKHKSKSKDESSSSDEDSDDEMEWVVKGSQQPAKTSKPPSKQYGVTMPPPAYIGEAEDRAEMDEEKDDDAAGSETKRDDWLSSPFMMATYSRDDIRKEKNAEKEKEKEKNSKLLLDEPGQSVRELNPFWKDGGTGMPEEDPSKKRTTPTAGVGDGGVGWLKKAFRRVKEQAEEQGRSLEELAAERWGSLERYYELLAEAEGAGGHSVNRNRQPWRRDGDRPYDRNRHRDDRYRSDRDRYQDRRSNHDRDRGRTDSNRDRDQGRRDNNYDRDQISDHDRSQSGRDSSMDRDRRRDSPSFLKPGVDNSSSSRTFMKPGAEDSSSRTFMKPGAESSSSERTLMKPGDSDSSSRRAFMKPGDEGSSSYSSSSSRRDYKSQFRKPGENEGRQRPPSTGSSLPSWKKSFKKPGEDTASSSRTEPPRSSVWRKPSSQKMEQKQEEMDTSTRKRRSSSSGSSSSGSSSGSSSDEDAKERRRSPTPPPPVKMLSESEMNQLGAKIVKAELMGNEALAQKLKAKLEAARQAKAQQPRQQPSQSTVSKGREDEDDEVVLTRTDRSGQSWPLPDRTVPAEQNTGRRKKKQKVVTHNESGQRQRYFGDDDELDLKTMVQREKMSSAEDQQKLFSRMAAKSMDKLDMDHTLDDMFVSSAAKKESKAQEEERDRSRAIAEHRRMAASLSKCRMCVDSPEMQKHLIIALGMKVYLSVPATKSLSQGHCLIIPMQHSIASTGLDEDVWSEIQIYRKGLTRMFEDHDMDAIFMETCMNPKKQRHMCIECVPVPKETGDLAPIYFKKAIQESESEWMTNKKLIDTRNKGLRKSVPAGFPFFSVEFGLDGGFAHIIEDEQLFPHYFGKEIIGGMLDTEPMLWRRPHKQNFEDQRKKVLEFAEWWKPFDWTQKIDR